MDAVLRSFAYSLDYLREQVADVSDEQLVVVPDGFNNHPAWVIGHLTYSCQAMGGELGVNPWLPDAWQMWFGTGSSPSDDFGTLVSSKTELLEALAEGQRRISRAVVNMSDYQLNQPLPDEKYRNIMPTIRHALTQVLVAHTANHVGQLTLWRRMMQLAPIRPYL
jgi:hypothetical protein